MIAELSWWELVGSAQTTESLGQALRGEGVDAWATVPALAMKLWLRDDEAQRWGALMVWEDDRPPNEELPPNRASELIGHEAAFRGRFIVECALGGVFGRGALFADPPSDELRA